MSKIEFSRRNVNLTDYSWNLLISDPLWYNYYENYDWEALKNIR